MTNLNDLLIAVCSYYGIDIEKVKSKNRYKDCVTVRRVFCYLAKEHLYRFNSQHFNLTSIGEMINRNHEMVLYHHEKQTNFMAIYPRYKSEMKDIMENFSSGHYETDISKRYCTSLGYLGLAYVNDMEVDCKIF